MKDLFGYLDIDCYLSDIFIISALDTAYSLGLIHHLQNRKRSSVESISAAMAVDRLSLDRLVQVLVSYHVFVGKDGMLSFTDRFLRALQYEDLLVEKISYLKLVYLDILEKTSFPLPADTPTGRFTALFYYHPHSDYSASDWDRTVKWVSLMSTITRYDAPGCIQFFDFEKYRKMIDIGGNSGEMALQICKRNEHLVASVFDLPIVCDIGSMYLKHFPEGKRISFVKGDIRRNSFPLNMDLVVLKSFLHDWNMESVVKILKKVWESLLPGGSTLIYEFKKDSFSEIDKIKRFLFYYPFILCLRTEEDYIGILRELGFVNIKRRYVQENNHFLVSGDKPK